MQVPVLLLPIPPGCTCSTDIGMFWIHWCKKRSAICRTGMHNAVRYTYCMYPRAHTSCQCGDCSGPPNSKFVNSAWGLLLHSSILPATTNLKVPALLPPSSSSSWKLLNLLPTHWCTIDIDLDTYPVSHTH